jgi:diaminohydroxyphosphoribosylaminopyrimidine deaminase / 5-amino-6-(5-phosphoribosylamino)uracil reductase
MQAAEAQALTLALAEQAIGLSDPNPRVGCVLLDAQGQLLGQGHTQAVGGPHAEVMALRDAIARGREVRGATAYVTLEPCSHFGRTRPQPSSRWRRIAAFARGWRAGGGC